MADEKADTGSPMQTVWYFIALFAAIITLWFYNGGPERADLRGIFLAPPAPLGTGEAYGPSVGAPAESAPQTIDQPEY